MTYHELIELYKKGKLSEEQKEIVEKDIERQEAISEFLFEEGEIPGWEDLEKEVKGPDKTDSFKDISAKESEDEEKRFVKMIQASIRKAFIKMGVVVSAVVLITIFLVIFALPKVVDRFYYNPGEIVGIYEQCETNRMSLDLAVYSELFLPENYRENVWVEANGYGEYDINIMQASSYTNLFTNVAGKIERNKMTLYDSNLLSKPAGNVFMRDVPGVEDYFEGIGAAGYPQEAKQALQKLKDEDYYVAYVTLSEVFRYASFVEWCKKESPIVNPVWCAIAAKTEEGYKIDGNIGFIYAASCGSMFHDGNYPYLTQWDVTETTSEENGWIVSEEVMTTHMVSMLRYMEAQKVFNKLIGCEMDYEPLANNVEKNGLHIYGFVMIGKKDELIKMSNREEVAYIYTKPVR